MPGPAGQSRAHKLPFWTLGGMQSCMPPWHATCHGRTVNGRKRGTGRAKVPRAREAISTGRPPLRSPAACTKRFSTTRGYSDHIERERAEQRRLANLKRGDQKPEMETLPPREGGKTRDKVAAATGIGSGRTFRWRRTACRDYRDPKICQDENLRNLRPNRPPEPSTISTNSR